MSLCRYFYRKNERVSIIYTGVYGDSDNSDIATSKKRHFEEFEGVRLEKRNGNH